MNQKKKQIKSMNKMLLLLAFIGLSNCLFFDILSKFNLTKSLGEDCDPLHWCEGDLVCRDYRCSEKGTPDGQVAFTPSGPKCDKFHSCPDNSTCIKHRCDPTPNSSNTESNNSTNIEKNLNKLKNKTKSILK